MKNHHEEEKLGKSDYWNDNQQLLAALNAAYDDVKSDREDQFLLQYMRLKRQHLAQ